MGKGIVGRKNRHRILKKRLLTGFLILFCMTLLVGGVFSFTSQEPITVAGTMRINMHLVNEEYVPEDNAVAVLPPAPPADNDYIYDSEPIETPETYTPEADTPELEETESEEAEFESEESGYSPSLFSH